jgi:hypothetical protein
MNIHTVAENLRNTIADKEHLLDQYSRALDGDKMLYEQKIAVGAASKFVKINIDELKRILKDVEVCCEKHSDMSWAINPERMGQ